VKYNIPTLKKIEQLMEEADYIVRYEKGNFKSGYCLLRDKRIIVVNKFFDTESRINCFIDLLPQLSIHEDTLEEKSRAFLHQLKTREVEA